MISVRAGDPKASKFHTFQKLVRIRRSRLLSWISSFCDASFCVVSSYVWNVFYDDYSCCLWRWIHRRLHRRNCCYCCWMIVSCACVSSFSLFSFCRASAVAFVPSTPHHHCQMRIHLLSLQHPYFHYVLRVLPPSSMTTTSTRGTTPTTCTKIRKNPESRIHVLGPSS